MKKILPVLGILAISSSAGLATSCANNFGYNTFFNKAYIDKNEFVGLEDKINVFFFIGDESFLNSEIVFMIYSKKVGTEIDSNSFESSIFGFKNGVSKNPEQERLYWAEIIIKSDHVMNSGDKYTLTFLMKNLALNLGVYTITYRDK
ncbi:hypothetical protein SHELI_v1c00430 [Spiroplasma helicoides]|uniref:Lipoprotein n=1 Tax=Spiroplasma helicoides TaxID=216938 RepID=A0A1B3SJ98_9MOLU|nr:hypothetical protein [Spiroplasma helicoides]AOG59998.1 hypothetical protein SHELI_v1c00430 [Spiroplasma helicoides]